MFSFFNSPFFKKYLAQKNQSKIVDQFKLETYKKNIVTFNEIWGEIPFDYFQVYLTPIEIFEFNISKGTFKWLGENITFKSFINMVNHFYNKNTYQSTQSILNDTLNQLSKLSNPLPPKRWRLMEFHDHISQLYLEKTIENKSHNTDIIPNKREINEWKIFQPKDTLELAIWGKKVRNCVLSYEDKILSGASAIILIEKEGVPKYTFELDYNSIKKGDLVVKQCVGFANSSITTDEKSLCESLIISAIQ